MMATQEQAVDVGRNDSQRTLQFVDSCEYFILPFEDPLRIGFNSQAVRIVITNMDIEVVYQTKLLFEQIYKFGHPLGERDLVRLFFPYRLLQYRQGIVPTVTETFGNAVVKQSAPQWEIPQTVPVGMSCCSACQRFLLIH